MDDDLTRNTYIATDCPSVSTSTSNEHTHRHLLPLANLPLGTTKMQTHGSKSQQHDSVQQTQQQQYSQGHQQQQFEKLSEDLKQHTHGHEAQQNFNYQQVNETHDLQEQEDLEKAQHCALEIFTSISQHVNNAIDDFNIANDERNCVSRAQATQSLKCDSELNFTVQNRLNENVCQSNVLSSVTPNVQVPVSVSEDSQPLIQANQGDLSYTDESHLNVNIDMVKAVKVSLNTDTKKLDLEENSLPFKDDYKCPCKYDFIKHADNKVKKYICGSCCSKFISICLLHDHLELHGSGGSYHFDHISHTAFPKYDTFCSFTQTENDYHIRTDESIVIKDVNSCDEVKATKTVIQQSGNLLSSKPEVLQQKLAAPSRHRRKQINPKPKKLTISYQKKNDKIRKSKSKLEGKDKINPEVYIKNSEMYIRKDTKEDMIDSDVVEESKTTKETDSVGVYHGDEIEGSVTTSITREISDESKNIVVIKPFKKRGRPRKTEGLNETRLVKKRRIMKKKKMVGNRDNKKGTKIDIIQENDISWIMEETKETDVQSVDTFNCTTSSEIVKVKQKVRKNASKLEMCDVCGLPVPKYNYVYHMRRHTGEKPYVCDKCGKAFAHRRFLVKHMLIHVEDKPWKCELCSAQFCQKTEYSMHMNAHQGNRPHECRVCGMKFLSKGMLNTHQANVHMGITRFECEICNRRFFKRSSLNVHQATHYEATMKCHYCDRMFKDKAGLKRHERIHTGEKRFRCHICSHEFIQSTPYWVHMEKRHQMDRESVKNMLKDIQESNKRHGIPTEINVLPKNVDHLLVASENSENKQIKASKSLKKNTSEKSDGNLKSAENVNMNSNLTSHRSFHQIKSEDNTINAGPLKSYTNIKVPNFNTSNVSAMSTSNIYSSPDNNEPLSLQQNFRYITSGQEPDIVQTSHCGPGSASLQEVTSANCQSLGVPASIPVPVSLTTPEGLHINLLNHGFIGLNPLQQASDYSSSIPPSTGNYTDISHQHR